MLDARSVLALHPQGLDVHDARGRQLHGVFACDPETGEVIMVDWRPTLWHRLTTTLRTMRHQRWRWLAFRSHVPTRHGFWPAPLTITPREPGNLR
jgi:hypothetical protein